MTSMPQAESIHAGSPLTRLTATVRFGYAYGYYWFGFFTQPRGEAGT